MAINMSTAQDYIMDYLENSDCDPIEWDVFNMASELVEWVDGAGVASFDDVPSDVFTEMLEGYAW